MVEINTELIWGGKYDKIVRGKKIPVERIPLPFQIVETINEPRVLKRLNEPDIRQILINVFKKAILELTIKPQKVKFEGKYIKLSDTGSFPWTKKLLKNPEKSIFNKVACENNLELDFAKFLEDARDVVSYSKLEKQKTRFYIEYIAPNGSLHIYYPDFIVKTKERVIYLLETKGREDLIVQIKDQRAKEWSKDASILTNQKWEYLKITEGIFRSTNAINFKQLKNHQLVRGYNK